MAAFSTAIALGGLAVAGAGTLASAKYTKKQVQAQNEALSYQRQQNDLAAARQKRDAIRSARMARAAAENAAATQGVADSSGAAGGVGSIVSQLNSNLSFLDTWNKYSDMASEALGRANVYGQRAQLAQTVTRFGVSAFQNSDVISGKLEKIFGTSNQGAAA